MHLLTRDGRVLHNADALSVLCRRVWWLWPIGFLLLAPGLRELGRLTYDWFARNRYSIGGACRLDEVARDRIAPVDWIIALLIPLFAGLASWNSPSWLLMWAVAFGFGFGLKWVTWRDAVVRGACPTASRATLWFLLWPGMDARAFLADVAPVKQPGLHDWIQAAATTILGVALIWVIAPAVLTESATTAAWLGMIGTVLFLHFGLFGLISILYRQFGVNAQPIMNAPLRATSLTEFWGTRWNTAFSIPARRLALLPLARRIGLPAAALLVFLISGLLHEAVISLPARGGFGLPTLYFSLQGAGVMLERSRLGRCLGLGKSFTGWLFTFLTIVGPLYWLFHPAFVRNVSIPFVAFLNNS